MKWVVFIFIGILLSFIAYDRIQIEKLSEEVSLLKQNNETIHHKATRFVKRESGSNKIFSYLHEINHGNLKVKYLPGSLLVEDASVVASDEFLDLLDYLYDQNQLIEIEIPENEKNVRKELQVAGFSKDLIVNSKDGYIKVRYQELSTLHGGAAQSP